MTTIDHIEVVIADIPTIRPHVLAMATMHSQAVVLVFLRRSDGIVGVGEATTIGGLAYGEESPESVKVNIETYFAPILKACDADYPAAAMALLGSHIVGNRFAKCAVETALYDGLGQAEGKPVSDYFGGALTDRLEVAWTLASGDTGADIYEGERMLAERRHRHFKLKIGKRSVAADVAHVGAICKAFAGRASVRVDVNQNWSEPQANIGMGLLHDVGVDLVEQPIARDDEDAMARLSVRHSVPLMADEALNGPRSAFRLAAAGAARVYAVKIAQSGGLHAAGAVAAIASAAGIGLYGGTMLEGGVGTAASAHLFSTFPDLAWGTELFGPLLLTEEILAAPLTYSDFELTVPTGPGLGIALDTDKIAFFRRDRTATIVHAVA